MKIKSLVMRDVNILSVSLTVLLTALLIISVLRYFSAIEEVYDGGGFNDFYKFYLSASESLGNANPYWPAPKLGSECGSYPEKESLIDKKVGELNPPTKIQETIHPNLNPPVMIALVKLIAHMEYRKAWVVYSCISLMLGVISVILALSSCAGWSLKKRFIVFVVFFAYYPCLANIEYGQVSFFLLSLLVVAWLCFRKGEEFLSGFFLGLLAGFKPFFALFAVSFFSANRYGLLLAMVFGFIVTILVGGFFVGFQYYKDYMDILGQVSWLASSWNASFAGFFSRIFGGSEGGSLFHYPVFGKYLYVASCIVIVVVLNWQVGLDAKSGKARSYVGDSVFSMTVPVMLLVSPLGWLYYFPLLIVSFIIFYYRIEFMGEYRVFNLLMTFGISMSYLPSFLVSSCQYKAPLEVLWTSSLSFYSLFFVFVLLFAYARASRLD